MEKIPTAEELIRNIARFESPNDVIPIHSLDKIMIEFAKLHVEMALRAAISYGEIDFEEYGGGIEGGDINHESILNAYPLENIK